MKQLFQQHDELCIDIESSPQLNLAMVENSIPLIKRISISNRGDLTLNDLAIEVSLTPQVGGDLFANLTWIGNIQELRPEATYHLDEVDVSLQRESLLNQAEQQSATIDVLITWGTEGENTVSARKAVQILACNEWHAHSVPQLLSAFVMPNHPVIAETLKLASVRLGELTGNAILDGYQSKSPPRARHIAQAIYETLQDLDITCNTPAASLDATGQKVRTPEQLLEHRIGSSLDISVFLCACLEQAGMNPLIFLSDGTAFVGLWLIDYDMAEAHADDGSKFSKLTRLGTILPFDSAAVAQRPAIDFDRAISLATDHLTDGKSFDWGLCIAGARKQRYKPLPTRMSHRYQLAPTELAIRRPEQREATQVRSEILRIAHATTALPFVFSEDREDRPLPEEPAEIGRIATWKRRLLDTSLRNRLLNYRETKSSVRLACPNIHRFEDLLADGEVFEVLAKPTMFGDSDPRSAALMDTQIGTDTLHDFLADVMDDGKIHALVSPQAHANKLTGIYRQAKESVQETGSNTLCVALGALHWYESETSTTARIAPILLIPVHLVRSANDNRFQLSSRDEGTRINVTLLEKIKMDLGIDMPELEQLPTDECGVDVLKILNTVRKAILNVPRWDVRDEVVLGHFSFTKFLMWNDLEAKSATLLDSTLVHHLALGQGKAYPQQGDFPDSEWLDSDYAADSLVCPLDADSTQLAAIATAFAGRTFVLQGPPGTGKSQTITNMIAQCLAHNKRVLFVSEKMAALDVVHRRLSSVGLGNYCLELHSNKAKKADIISELERTFQLTAQQEPEEWQQATEDLDATRRNLNEYALALHTVHDHGLSYFQVLSRLIPLKHTKRVPFSTTHITSAQQLRDIQRKLDSVSASARAVSPIEKNPWLHATLPNPGLSFQDEVAEVLEEFSQACDTLSQAGRTAAKAFLGQNCNSLQQLRHLCDLALALETTPKPSRVLLNCEGFSKEKDTALQLISLGESTEVARAQVLTQFDAGIFDLNVERIAAKFHRWGTAFFLLSWWMLRAHRKALRLVSKADVLPDDHQLTMTLESSRTVQKSQAQLDEMRELGTSHFTDRWSAPNRDWDAMRGVVQWSEQFCTHTSGLCKGYPRDIAEAVQCTLFDFADGTSRLNAQHTEIAETLAEAMTTFLNAMHSFVAKVGLHESLAFPAADSPDYFVVLSAKMAQWQAGLPGLKAWQSYLADEAWLTEQQLSRLSIVLRRGTLAPGHLRDAFDRTFYQSWASAVLQDVPALANFEGQEQARKIQTFQDLDRKVIDLSGPVAASRVSARDAGSTANDSEEVGTLLREAKKKRSQKTIRQLFQHIPNLLNALKPCILMSPLSVAQYLDPEAEPFDLVIFDEASQMPTHDSIGALARGRNAVIVGDTKQLPPTSFFSSAGGDEFQDDDAFEELESILDECVASRVPEMQLGWHYRSRHESLIAFSNFHYYDNRLNTFPSVAERVPNLGVSLQKVIGHYDKGSTRTNPNEAQAVVEEVVARLTDSVQCQRSIGIVTFSKAQQELIENLLDEARRQHPSIERYFGPEVEEEIIVKNLENIQGDERDVMLFSICYGPDQNNKVSMNFGPMNRVGGERRLNVAVTRAREELVVFSTLAAEQIDLSRTESVGVRHLKTFLDYAARGISAIGAATAPQVDFETDSPFEREVFTLLAKRGWRVQSQVGCAGYRIDIGVYHPEIDGTFVLGIECDGAHYQSAKTARDRDRLRLDVLAGLGWKLHRIWSIDWWGDRDAEIEKVEAAIRAAMGSEVKEAAQIPTVSSVVDTETGEVDSVPVPVPYRTAEIPAKQCSKQDCYRDSHLHIWQDLCAQVLQVEAPISLRLFAKRIAPYWSLARTSKRLEQKIVEVIAQLPDTQQPTLVDGFYWHAQQSPEEYEGFRLSSTSAGKRDVADISLVELANAAASILAIQQSADTLHLIRETANLVGFQRPGKKVMARIRQSFEILLHDGRVNQDGETLRLVV